MRDSTSFKVEGKVVSCKWNWGTHCSVTVRMTPRQPRCTQPGTPLRCWTLSTRGWSHRPSAGSVPPPGGGEEPCFSIPRLSGKPLLPVLSCKGGQVSDSQMHLAMIPTMYLAPGTFPARSPITARGSSPVLGEGRRRNGVRGLCLGGISPQQGGGPSITGISMAPQWLALPQLPCSFCGFQTQDL